MNRRRRDRAVSQFTFPTATGARWRIRNSRQKLSPDVQRRLRRAAEKVQQTFLSRKSR
jgi:hypothetical protein